MARLQVMTWNVQNLFLPEHEDGPDTQEAFDEKLASLAGVIDRTAPDVAALQEIGPDVLGRLQAALTHRLTHAAASDPDDRGIRVALLSTRPLAEVGRIRLFPAGVRAVQAKDEVFDDPITANVDESMTLEMGRGALEATRRRAGDGPDGAFQEQADHLRPPAGHRRRLPVRAKR